MKNRKFNLRTKVYDKTYWPLMYPNDQPVVSVTSP